MKVLSFILWISLLAHPVLASKSPPLVDGVGGVFLYAEDPAGLAKWYKENLEISFETDGKHYFVIFPQPENKFTVFSIFPAKEKKSGHQFILNLRLNDLDATLKKLKDNGIKIDKQEDYDYGRFAWFSDGDGNEVEVWQPK